MICMSFLIFIFTAVYIIHRYRHKLRTKLDDLKVKVYKQYGIVYPPFATWTEWSKIRKQVRDHKFLHFFFESIPSWLGRMETRYRDIKYWVLHRTTDKYHIIRTELKPGYYDVDTRLMYGMFALLKMYVEEECSHMYYFCHKDAPKPNKWNKRSLGIRHLVYDIFSDYKENERPKEGSDEYIIITNQMARCKEILDLYSWWVFDRPRRPDPMETSGLSEWYDKVEKKHGDIFLTIDRENQTEEENAEWRVMHNKDMEIEEAYQKEDTEMMKKLIDLRGSLWT